jgi:nicotinamidase-related amidase
VQHAAVDPRARLFAPATYGAAIHASVAPESGEAVIVKHWPNAFRGTVLLDVLRRTGVRDLVVCGATTHACVDSTVRAAFDLGLACAVAADACATLDLELQGRVVKAADVQTAFLAALCGSFARVVQTADVLTTA